MNFRAAIPFVVVADETSSVTFKDIDGNTIQKMTLNSTKLLDVVSTSLASFFDKERLHQNTMFPKFFSILE